MNKSKIEISIYTDDNNIPEKILWKHNQSKTLNTKSIIMSIWDEKTKKIFKIDVWTKNMKIEDMKIFFYQIFLCISDTYIKATLDDKIGNEIKKFAIQFAKNVNII